MTNNSLSLRLSIALTIITMGIVSLAVAIFTGETYQAITLSKQRATISTHIQRDTNEVLDYLNIILSKSGLNLQHDKLFRKAFKNRQKDKIQEIINSYFHQYYVTAGIIELEKIYVYDVNFNLVTASTEKPKNNFSKIICSNLINKAKPRSGADRLITLSELCTTNNRIFFSSLVPIGGLVPKGYLQVVANPVHNMKKLDGMLGSPVLITLHNNGEVYKSENWPDDIELKHILSADFKLFTDQKEFVGTISTAYNIRSLNMELNETRSSLIFLALIVTSASMFIGFFILKKSTTNPVNNILSQLKKIQKNKDNLGNKIEITGAHELKQLAIEFNHMSDELKELYQQISEKNRLLGEEVSERKFAEEALKVAHEVLEQRIEERTKNLQKVSEQAQKASLAKSEFLSRMSHELRTPLNAILGYSELMLSNPKEKLSNYQHENLEIIYRSGMHLLSLINEVLDLSSIDSGQIILANDEVSLEDVVKETFSIISPIAEENNITLFYSVKDISNIYINTEHQRLKQILLNLLSNAIKYNKKNGKVTFLIECISDEMLKISVEDTGIGIEENQLDEIFSPFNRLKEYRARVDGTGIGLTIAKSLVELMGGEIGIRSTVSEGSVFWITIPYYEKSAIAGTAEEEDSYFPGTDDSFEGKKVLIVEDDEINQELIATMLSTFSVDSDIAENGIIALEKLQSNNDYAFIFMDLNMPKMGGIEATEVIRKLDSNKSEIIIIALTANAMQEDKEKCFEVGMNDFIKKPFSLKELKEALEKWL